MASGFLAAAGIRADTDHELAVSGWIATSPEVRSAALLGGRTINNAVTPTLGLAAAVVTAATMPATAIDMPPSWNPPVVVDAVPNYFLDFAAYEGQSRYLAYDHFGQPGIAYSNSGFTHYARPIAGLGWIDEIVDDPDVYSLLLQPSLAYGLDEMPHLSWSGGIIAPFEAVYHASFNGLQWDIDFYAFGDFVVPGQMTSSLLIDLLGRPGIAYSVDGSILYRSDTDGDGLMLGEPDCLLIGTNPPIESSAASDSLGQVMIAYSNNGQLIFSARPLGHECFSTDIITVGALVEWRNEHPVWTPARIELALPGGRRTQSGRYDVTIILSAAYVAGGERS
jgi:hypothetical protein